jgi:hypothetical protein
VGAGPDLVAVREDQELAVAPAVEEVAPEVGEQGQVLEEVDPARA